MTCLLCSPAWSSGHSTTSILRRATQAHLISIHVHDIRAFTFDRHHTADDSPYGGGAGQVLKVEPIVAAVETINGARTGFDPSKRSVILLSARGRRFSQEIAQELSLCQHVILICGHYEGVDDRVRDSLAAEELSIGDFVLTGGELPAMVIVDAVARLVPGVLGSAESLDEESIASGLLEYPQFTRPPVYRGLPVPPVLLTGDHSTIRRWRRARSVAWTFVERPDLLERAALHADDVEAMAALVDLTTFAATSGDESVDGCGGKG